AVVAGVDETVEAGQPETLRAVEEDPSVGDVAKLRPRHGVRVASAEDALDGLARLLRGREISGRAGDAAHARGEERREAEKRDGHHAQRDDGFDEREAAVVHRRVHWLPFHLYPRTLPVAPSTVIARTDRAPPLIERKTVPLIGLPAPSTSMPSLVKKMVGAPPKSMAPFLPKASGVSGTPATSAYCTRPSSTAEATRVVPAGMSIRMIRRALFPRNWTCIALRCAIAISRARFSCATRTRMPPSLLMACCAVPICTTAMAVTRPMMPIVNISSSRLNPRSLSRRERRAVRGRRGDSDMTTVTRARAGYC